MTLLNIQCKYHHIIDSILMNNRRPGLHGGSAGNIVGGHDLMVRFPSLPLIKANISQAMWEMSFALDDVKSSK
jgi:hypothetical protein